MTMLMFEEFVEDFNEWPAPAGSRRHRPLQVGCCPNALLNGEGQRRSACAQFVNELLCFPLPPAADLTRVPSVFVERLSGTGRGLTEGGFHEARDGLLSTAEMSEQIVSRPSFVARRPVPGLDWDGAQFRDRGTAEFLPAVGQPGRVHQSIRS